MNEYDEKMSDRSKVRSFLIGALCGFLTIGFFWMYCPSVSDLIDEAVFGSGLVTEYSAGVYR